MRPILWSAAVTAKTVFHSVFRPMGPSADSVVASAARWEHNMWHALRGQMLRAWTVHYGLDRRLQPTPNLSLQDNARRNVQQAIIGIPPPLDTVGRVWWPHHVWLDSINPPFANFLLKDSKGRRNAWRVLRYPSLK